MSQLLADTLEFRYNRYMKQQLTGICVFIILIIAFLLRTYSISTIPPSLSWDEVSIGYNAYSLLKTGKDEHGRFMPLDTFIAYGDYKPPLYIYSTIPFIALFGLNEASVRLPSALFGTLTIFVVYLLLYELIQIKDYGLTSDNQKSFRNIYRLFPVVAALLLTFSPWHINISRAGFEANTALFFITLGIYLFFRTRRDPTIWYFVWIPFVASIYTFNSARVFSPLIALWIIFTSRHSLSAHKKQFVIGICIALILLVPIVGHLFSKEARLRFQEVNIFSDISIINTSNARISYENNAWWVKILQNRRVGYARSYLIHFFDHFELWYLFIRGDGNPKFSIQDVGQLYIADLFFLIPGILWMFSNASGLSWFLVYWLIASIIPAAAARETPHALRTLNGVPVWYIFISAGVIVYADMLLNGLRKGNILKRLMIVTVVAGIYMFNVGYYLHNYYSHYAKEFSGDWQYGYREALRYIANIEDNYQRIYITDTIGRPYMYTLFYMRYDPGKYLSERKSYVDASGFYHVDSFGKFSFVKGSSTQYKSGNLYVMPSGSAPPNAKILNTVKLLNGSDTLVIFEI